MTATAHSTRVWLVVDPPQDYEESLKVLGVYGSGRTARYAAMRLMRPTWRWEPRREVEVQERVGDELWRVWTWNPDRKTWVLCYVSAPKPCRIHDHKPVRRLA